MQINQWIPAIVAVAGAMAEGAQPVAPSRLYIVASGFSDNGPAFYYGLIEVLPDNPRALVRYTRIGPANVYCPRLIIQNAEVKVSETVEGLTRGINPCAVEPSSLAAELKKHRRTAGIFESVSFGIVAQCGSSSVVLGLPDMQDLHFGRLKSAHPEMARLWDMASEMVQAAFGTDILYERANDLALQRAGEMIVPELISGRYDAGLAAAFGGTLGSSPSFRSLLGAYRGVARSEDVNPAPRVVNIETYRFSDFAAPKYPPLAMQARIQGRVELLLILRPGTGEVQSATAVSGHPLLVRSAMQAAEQWKFEPDSSNSGTLSVALDYSLNCR